jgi:glucose/mannose-6-phosphate isomerase
MYSVDKSGYKHFLLNFCRQIQESFDIYESTQIFFAPEKARNILYLGIGGSGIVGDFLYDVLFDELKIPLDIVRSYFSPAYCGEDTLVIVSSYSGNTEETLSALKDAAATGAQILAVTSGGRLETQARENGWNLIKIPSGIPPRYALGYLFFPVYHFLGKAGFLKNYEADLRSLAAFICERVKMNDYPNINGHVFSRELAHTIQNKIPIFYSTSPYLRTVASWWQNQVQQSAKSLAFANVLPEINHNEIVGWEFDQETRYNFIVIFLENEMPHPRIQKRIELSKTIIKARGVEVVDIYSAGETILEKVFSLIILGDWVSYYLALCYKKDPVEIRHIDFLKSELAKMPLN